MKQYTLTEADLRLLADKWDDVSQQTYWKFRLQEHLKESHRQDVINQAVELRDSLSEDLQRKHGEFRIPAERLEQIVGLVKAHVEFEGDEFGDPRITELGNLLQSAKFEAKFEAEIRVELVLDGEDRTIYGFGFPGRRGVALFDELVARLHQAEKSMRESPSPSP